MKCRATTTTMAGTIKSCRPRPLRMATRIPTAVHCGNEPQMVAEKFDGASGELDFAFAGGSNIAPGAGHMHDAVFHLASRDHFDAKWDFVEAGKVKFSEEIHYTRT